MDIFNNLIIIDFISHLCGVIFPIFSSFFGHKYITFAIPKMNLKILELKSKNLKDQYSK